MREETRPCTTGVVACCHQLVAGMNPTLLLLLRGEDLLLLLLKSEVRGPRIERPRRVRKAKAQVIGMGPWLLRRTGIPLRPLAQGPVLGISTCS